MPTSDARADAQAARQDGVITRAQASACGLSRRQIAGRLDSGRWVTIVRGVYRNAAAPVTWQQGVTAAVLAGPPGTVASCTTAAALHGLLPARGTPHVIVPRTASSRSGLAVAHRTDVSARDRVMVGGIPRTSVARTTVDCAAELRYDELCDLVDRAFCEASSHRTVVLEAIDRAQDGGGKRGVAALRRALEGWTPGITPGSPAEMRLLRVISEFGVEEPERQIQVHDFDGRFIGRIDLGWRRRRLGFEYDSDRHHNPRHWARDEARQTRYAAAGWEVHRLDKHDLRAGSTRLRRLLDGLGVRRAA